MINWLDRYFGISASGSSFRSEVRGGLTTFMTMAYIIFVQPAILSIAGMSLESVFLATCLSAAVATLLMAFLSRYPVALAPGMGENIFFVFSVATATVGGQVVGYPAALTVVLISGLLFLLLTLLKVREKLLNSVPRSLRVGIGVGIGLFIAELGLMHGGIIRVDTVSLLPGLGNLSQSATLVALVGLLVTLVMFVRRIPGAILWGMILTAIFGLLTGVVSYSGIVSMPPTDTSAIFAFDFARVFSHPDFIALILVFLFMDLFDTMGTLVGVGERAGFIDEKGHLPRAEKAFLADAGGTVFGACVGTSTVTSFIESLSGIEAGARTGFASVVTGLLFIAALFFMPLVQMVGGGWAIPGMEGHFLYPVTAPALILVGAMMTRGVTRINWDDYVEAIPAFLVVVGIPLTFSIHDGLAFGFISYPLLMLATGRGRELNPVLIVVALIFVARYVFLP